MKIAIIIPAYNEELTIGDVITSFHHELPQAAIFIIDNNSSDRTNDIARATLASIKCKGGVLLEKRQGKGNAIRKAFHEIDADAYVMVDADMTYPASDVHALIKPIIARECDMVIGDRLSNKSYYRENKRKFHNFGNRLVQILINRLFGSRINDIMSGYRAFSKKFVKNYPILFEGFELETDLTLHALDKRYPLIEIPIQYKDRPEGSSSKLNTIRDGIKVLKTILIIFKDYKPLVFFGITGLILGCFGLITGSIVIHEFFTTRYITHVPLAILSSGMMIFSIIVIAIGIMMDSIERNNKKMYEHRLLHYRQ